MSIEPIPAGASTEVAAECVKRAVLYLRVSTSRQATRNGEAEGYSIPAQRSACERKVADLGAEVVREFVDAGASARSADRDGLQALLTHVAEGGVDYVVVHKLDRLARDRTDDVMILAKIQTAGATPVSVGEQIDETPAGMLMHNIFSGMAEFYSRNLASEAKKGIAQKAKNDGAHEPLVDDEAWYRVQDVLSGRRIAGDRSWRHSHYLKGSLLCGRCGGRMGYGHSRGKGGVYSYSFCLGRHTGRTDCDLPYVSVEKIERRLSVSGAPRCSSPNRPFKRLVNSREPALTLGKSKNKSKHCSPTSGNAC